MMLAILILVAFYGEVESGELPKVVVKTNSEMLKDVAATSLNDGK